MAAVRPAGPAPRITTSRIRSPPLRSLVPPRGFEPPTHGSGIRCSIRAELRGRLRIQWLTNWFCERCGHGVHIGVQLTHGLSQIILIDGMISLEHFHGPIPCNRHDPKVIYPSAAHVGHERMAEVMKHRASYT